MMLTVHLEDVLVGDVAFAHGGVRVVPATYSEGSVGNGVLAEAPAGVYMTR